jgi:hypothetical protein
MRRDVLAGDVADVLLVAVLIRIQHETGLPLLGAVAEPARPEEKAQSRAAC